MQRNLAREADKNQTRKGHAFKSFEPGRLKKLRQLLRRQGAATMRGFRIIPLPNDWESFCSRPALSRAGLTTAPPHYGDKINKCGLFIPKIAKKFPRAARGRADPYARRGQGPQIRQIPLGIDRIGADSAQIESEEKGKRGGAHTNLGRSVVEAHDEAELLLAAAGAGRGPVVVVVVSGAGVPAGAAARLGLLLLPLLLQQLLLEAEAPLLEVEERRPALLLPLPRRLRRRHRRGAPRRWRLLLLAHSPAAFFSCVFFFFPFSFAPRFCAEA